MVARRCKHVGGEPLVQGAICRNGRRWERRDVCSLKACGMGRPVALQSVESPKQGEGATSAFASEIELLMFDI